MQEVATTVQPLIQKNANRLEIRTGDALGSMHADVTKVRQCLFNLLSNACKFTEQGTIRLLTNREVGADGDVLCFQVSDNGIGMTPEQMGQTVPGVQPGRRVDHAQVRRDRASGWH